MKLFRYSRSCGYAVFLCLIFMSQSHAEEQAQDSCSSIDACISRMFDVATYGESYQAINYAERLVAKKFVTFGDKAVGPLVDLLDHEDENIAQIAGAALWEFNEIDEQYLNKIIDALNGPYYLSSLPATIGYIQTDQAAKIAVERFLISENPLGDQHSTAVHYSGLRAIPYVLDALLCEKDCPQTTNDLGSVLAKMSDEAKFKAVEQLGVLIASSETSQSKKADLIFVLAQIGPTTITLEQDLLLLREIDENLEDVINFALVEMKSMESGNIISAKLKKEPTERDLYDLIRVGIAGKDAEPTVLKLLQHKDRHIRHTAAIALAFSGSDLSTPALTTAATDDSDVVLNFLATRALGQIRATKAKSVLVKLENSHWHEAVRRAASLAIENLSSNNYSRLAMDDLFRELDDWTSLGTKNCDKTGYIVSDDSNPYKLYRRTDSGEIKKLHYKSVIVSYGPSDYQEQLANDTDGIIEVHPGNLQEFRESIDQIPDVAIKVLDGWLVGTSRGEWGGELVHLDKDLKSKYIIEANIDDINYFGNKYIAISGIAHMGIDDGVIYELGRSVEGKWEASVWRYLPSSPVSSWIAKTGELVINTYDGGTIVVDKLGELSLAICDTDE